MSYEVYRQIRDLQGFKSDAEVARKAGITVSTFSDWKSGRSEPKMLKLAKIAQALECDTRDLMADVLPPIQTTLEFHVSDTGDTYRIEGELPGYEVRALKRLSTYYRLMSDRDKEMLIDIAHRMAQQKLEEEGDPYEEP